MKFGITIEKTNDHKVGNKKNLTRREKLIANIERILDIRINSLRKTNKSSTIYLSNKDLVKINQKLEKEL